MDMDLRQYKLDRFKTYYNRYLKVASPFTQGLAAKKKLVGFIVSLVFIGVTQIIQKPFNL